MAKGNAVLATEREIFLRMAKNAIPARRERLRPHIETVVKGYEGRVKKQYSAHTHKVRVMRQQIKALEKSIDSVRAFVARRPDVHMGSDGEIYPRSSKYRQQLERILSCDTEDVVFRIMAAKTREEIVGIIEAIRK